MGYNFITIDGLFRPNYNIYEYSSKDSKEVEPQILEPVLVTYKPQDINRIKSIITETSPVKNTWDADKLSDYNWPIEIPDTAEQEITIPYKVRQTSSNSRNLLQYLKDKEQFRDIKYQDSGGVWTIGYGFTDPEIVKRGTLTEQEASDLLVKEIESRRNKLRSQITTWDKLNQNQQDALISYSFNVGAENWKRFQPKLLAALNEERFSEAAKYMDAVRDKKGQTLAGLVKRRKEEQEWFNS